MRKAKQVSGDQRVDDNHQRRVASAPGHSRSDDQSTSAGRDPFGGHQVIESQHARAADAPGQAIADNHTIRAGGAPVSNGDHLTGDNQPPSVASGAADQSSVDNRVEGVRGAVLAIRIAHRRRRYAMKLQQKIDRACESYIRSNYTDWTPDMDDANRERIRREIQAHLKQARSSEHADPGLVGLVQTTDKTREPIDTIRSNEEKKMAEFARQLPGYGFVESVAGAGAIGFATIVAECSALNRGTGEITTLDDYPHWSKVWKRLGFAPYDGLAGSSWKREKWRPRSLSSEEWVANPFSGERYALMIMVADALFRKQWQSAEKAGTDEGRPTGVYGQVYADRRRVTAVTHPDWTKQHAKADALRVMMKSYLKELWHAWHNEKRTAKVALMPNDEMPSAAPGQDSHALQSSVAGRVHSPKR